jgi:osmotically-inducible protein OsmY
MAWITRGDRTYYQASDLGRDELPSDRDVKSTVVHRLRENPYTEDFRIRVEVTNGVVVLGGRVDSPMVKRVAGDDTWEVPGVVDVSNQLTVRTAA